MYLQREQSKDETIQALQCRVNELVAANLVLQKQYVHQANELSELTTANSILQKQLKDQEQFIAMIAHELLSPLTSIITYAQMIVRQHPDLLQRNTSVIIGQARRLYRLVNDLRDASRLSSGQFALVCDSCDIVAVATEMVEHLRPLATHHTLIAETPDTSIRGCWDVIRLQQVVGNLLDNAIKYSDENTTITLRVWDTPDIAHVSVHNQGTSIPSADVAQLFRPYGRLAATRGRRGSGLGLYITKSIIEAHGGMLRLEPHKEGTQGTTFSFDLPLVAASA